MARMRQITEDVPKNRLRVLQPNDPESCDHLLLQGRGGDKLNTLETEGQML